MFEKFSRSWELVKASASVLRSDKQLMLFPVISSMVSLVVLATFLIPLSLLGLFAEGFGAGAVVFGFLFYFCQYAVVIFFNSALVAAAMIRLEGGDPTLADGFNAARARIPAILGYAAIAATVGVLLQSLKNSRNNFIVRLIGSGLGVAWTLGTFLVVPVLVSRDVGPIDALKESVSLFKRTWGESAIGTVGIGAAFWVVTVGTVLVGVLLTILAAQAWLGLAILVGGLFLIAVVLLAVFQSALSGVYSAALYQFATTNEAPPAFHDLHLEQAITKD